MIRLQFVLFPKLKINAFHLSKVEFRLITMKALRQPNESSEVHKNSYNSSIIEPWNGQWIGLNYDLGHKFY